MFYVFYVFGFNGNLSFARPITVVVYIRVYYIYELGLGYIQSGVVFVLLFYILFLCVYNCNLTLTLYMDPVDG